MHHPTSRRDFLKSVIRTSAAGVTLAATARATAAASSSMKHFELSLAQWSLHRAFQSGARDPLDFARIAKRDFGIQAVEYVNQFYFDTLTDKVVAELRQRAEGEGVRSVLIMCDREGQLGDPDDAARTKTVANHHRWANAAKALGCHAIRVNAQSAGSYDEQMKLAADGLRQLAEYCDPLGLSVLVENHGGLSSNGQWLSGVMEMATHPRVGTLPDFGNFTVNRQTGERYDIYQGVTELMRFARAVSAKSYDFDDATGEETTIDFHRMMDIVTAAGYTSYVGIEYEGNRLSEPDGIRATKRLLDKIRAGYVAA